MSEKNDTLGAQAIPTIEGLEQNWKLHPVQEAFLEAGAMQCGYCTCGMILAGVALLRRNPSPTPREIVRGIVPDTGSGYGGKHTGEAAIEAARLAKAAGRPVKLAWTREEEFSAFECGAVVSPDHLKKGSRDTNTS